MKVLGHVDIGHRNTYLCEVSHEELEKFMDLYYNKLDKLKVGDYVDLSKGRDFFLATTEALAKTEAFISANQKVIDAIFTGISVMGRANKSEGA